MRVEGAKMVPKSGTSEGSASDLQRPAYVDHSRQGKLSKKSLAVVLVISA